MQMVNIVHEHLIEELLILTVFGFVIVQLELRHSLLGPLSFLSGQLLLTLILLLLGGLNSFELIKDVLIMKNRVGELISEVVFIQKLLDSLGNHWISKDSVDIRSFFWVDAEHTLQQVLDILAEMRWYIVILTNNDFPGQLMERLGIEGWLKCTHFVKEYTE